MAIFPQSGTAKKDSTSFSSETQNSGSQRENTPAVADFEPATHPLHAANSSPRSVAPAAPAAPAQRESVIAADLTIEGRIEGSGDVRIAGRFKGDVNVEGNLTIEKGAKLEGAVRAKQVLVSGELEGNIESASLVELRDSAVLTGDLKAGSLTVAAGSKIRGLVECGWDEEETVPAPTPAPTGNQKNASNAKDKAASDKSSD